MAQVNLPWHFFTELVQQPSTVCARWFWTSPDGARSATGFNTFHDCCEDAKAHGMSPDETYTINDAFSEHLACS
jgi:hypothetical protein